MEARARLIDVTAPGRAEGAVLVLHGGGDRRGRMRVSPAQLSVVRMIPIARSVARAGRGRVAVLRLLNTHRGWDSRHTPVGDVRWALGQLAERFGPHFPVALIGHSLGGRAALLSAGEDQVSAVVALAPWLAPSDPLPDSTTTPVLIVHGDQDRIALPQHAAAYAERLGQRTDVSFEVVEGGGHAMLRHHDRFVRPAADFALASLRTR